MNDKQSCKFVSVIGATNAGKSTLINRLIGKKISIVSRKAQTTRHQIMGLLKTPSCQIILIDTPGIFYANNRLGRSMVSAAWRSVDDSGLVLHVVDCTKGNGEQQKRITQFLANKSIPSLLVLNKIDLSNKLKLLQLIAEFDTSRVYKEIFLISAAKDIGLEQLKISFGNAISTRNFPLAENHISNLSIQLLACEIVREHLFDRLHQEIPYGLTVNPEQWHEISNVSLKCSMYIQVQKLSHKIITIGKGGKNLSIIGFRARQDIAKLVEIPISNIYLNLFVKVNPHWQEDIQQYQLWDLDFHL